MSSVTGCGHGLRACRRLVVALAVPVRLRAGSLVRLILAAKAGAGSRCCSPWCLKYGYHRRGKYSLGGNCVCSACACAPPPTGPRARSSRSWQPCGCSCRPSRPPPWRSCRRARRPAPSRTPQPPPRSQLLGVALGQRLPMTRRTCEIPTSSATVRVEISTQLHMPLLTAHSAMQSVTSAGRRQVLLTALCYLNLLHLPRRPPCSRAATRCSRWCRHCSSARWRRGLSGGISRQRGSPLALPARAHPGQLRLQACGLRAWRAVGTGRRTAALCCSSLNDNDQQQQRSHQQLFGLRPLCRHGGRHCGSTAART